jgi:hypothetical protein
MNREMVAARMPALQSLINNKRRIRKLREVGYDFDTEFEEHFEKQAK